MGRTWYTQWLYKIDGKGKTRQWQIELFESNTGEVYQKVTSGLSKGKLTDRVKLIEPVQGKPAWERAISLSNTAKDGKIRDGYRHTIAEAKQVLTMPRPQKALTYNPGLVLPTRIFVQPKINGLRCPYDGKELLTKTGLIWHIPEVKEHVHMLYTFMEDNVPDGELFIPGLPVGSIMSAAKTFDNPDRKRFEYHCYDIINDEVIEDRIERRIEAFRQYELAVPASQRICKYVPTYLCFRGPEELKMYYDRFLHQGHEGLIVRLVESYYQRGQRSEMWKWKPTFDGEFQVVGITYENRIHDGVRKPLVEFICLEPVTGHTFKAVPSWSVEERYSWYQRYGDGDLKSVIAQLPPLNVEWREVTSNQIPFHAVAKYFREDGY